MQIPGGPARHPRLFQVISRPTPAPAEPTKLPHSLDYLTDYPDYLSPFQHYAPRTVHGYYQALRSGFSGLATRHVQSPDCHSPSRNQVPRSLEPARALGHLARLFSAIMSSQPNMLVCARQSCRKGSGCCTAAGGTERRPRLPITSALDRGPARIPNFSILAANWHTLPFESILLPLSIILSLLCMTGLQTASMFPKTTSNKFMKAGCITLVP